MSDPVAPEFPPDLEWVNASAPVSLADLEADFAAHVVEDDEIRFDEAAGRVRARRVRRLGGAFDDGAAVEGTGRAHHPHLAAHAGHGHGGPYPSGAGHHQPVAQCP